MRHIRSLIYKLGFRPKPGSIFFSPSRALYLAYVESIKNPRITYLPREKPRMDKES